MSNERGSVHIALEALLLLNYAWNLCPIPSTDIFGSLVAVGRKFSFPIDFLMDKQWELTSSLSAVESYSKDLADCLSACHEISCLLVSKDCAWHRELVNSLCRNPCIFHVRDIVFA
jgi:hypothetical protein